MRRKSYNAMVIRMQCKDIPDEPILRMLARNVGWCMCFNPDEEMAPWTRSRNVMEAMPHGISRKLAIAKMGMLIRRGLADGCTCGCRGDFSITDKGREHLAKLDAAKLQEAQAK